MKTQTFDLKKMKVTELSNNESAQTNGGWNWKKIISKVAGYIASRGGGSSSPSASCTVTINN